jgi:hypothetical protein
MEEQVHGSPPGQTLEQDYATGAPVYASAASLLTPVEEAETVDVKLPNGAAVKVRGLTRKELLDSGAGTEDTALIEARNVAAGLVRPAMTLAQVQQWQRSAGTVRIFADVTNAIRDLSGLGEGAGKSDVDQAGD